MTKSANAFRTISEVAGALDVPQHVLRFWESKFSQVKPMKRAGGRRYYRPEDIELLRGIRVLLYGDGYTIKGVQKVLKEKGPRFVADAGQGSAQSPQIAPDAPAPEPVASALPKEDPAKASAAQRDKLQRVLSDLTEIQGMLRELGN